MTAKLAYYGWILLLFTGFSSLIFGKGAIIVIGIATGVFIAVIGILIFTMYLHDAAKYGTFNHNKWPNQ